MDILISGTKLNLKLCYKVSRFLARYSPCTTTTNQPTNRAINELARPIYVPKKAYFGAKMAVFGPNILIIL